MLDRKPALWYVSKRLGAWDNREVCRTATDRALTKLNAA